MARREKVLVFLGIALVGIMASILIFWITAPYGPGINPDSIGYIVTANNLLTEKGFLFRNGLPTHFPPGYPLVLAGVGFLTKDVIEAARIVNALLFGINLILVALTVYLSTARSLLTTSLGIAIFLLSPPILNHHLWAMSEPLFIAFSLIAIILLSLYATRPRWFLIVTGAASLGFAAITRYAGISLFLPAALFLLAFRKGTIRQRARDTVLGLLLSSIPLVVWFLHTAQTGMLIGNRTLVFHPPSAIMVIAQLYKIMRVFPGPPWLKGTLLGLLTTLGATLLVNFSTSANEHLRKMGHHSLTVAMSILCVFFSVCYIALLFLTITFIDAMTPLDTRLLLPVFIFLMIATVLGIWAGAKALRKPLTRWCFAVLLLILFAVNGLSTASLAINAYRNGLGYSSSQWRNSECIAFIKSVPDNIKVYSNERHAIGFLTNKKTTSLPRRMNPYTLKPNPKFKEELRAIGKECKEEGALLVYLNTSQRSHLPTLSEVESIGNLPVLRRLADGVVYGVEKAP